MPPKKQLQVLPVVSEKAETAKSFKHTVQIKKEEMRADKEAAKAIREKIKLEIIENRLAAIRRKAQAAEDKAKKLRKVEKANEEAMNKSRHGYQTDFQPAGYEPFTGLDYEPFVPPPAPIQPFMPVMKQVATAAAQMAAQMVKEELDKRDAKETPRKSKK